MRLSFFSFIMITLSSLNFIQGQTFLNNGIKFTITGAKTVEVTSDLYGYSGSINIPDKVNQGGVDYDVTGIGLKAFYNCAGLTNVTLPSLLTTIGNQAFLGCTFLTSVIVPTKVISIGESAFDGCGRLASITLPSGIISIGDWAFGNCALASITIPASVQSIGYLAFFGNGGDFMVDANNLNYASQDGLLYNKDLSTLIQCPVSKSGSLILPNTVSKINDWAFRFCSKLTNISITSPLESIGVQAFGSCSKLTSITIPSTVTSIGTFAFGSCSSLSSIYCKLTTPLNLSTSPNVFYMVNKNTCTLYVPTGAKNSFQASSQWNEFTNIVEHNVTSLIIDLNESNPLIINYNSALRTMSVDGLTDSGLISIYDINGRILQSWKICKNGEYSVDVSDNGVFIVKLIEGENTLVKKIIL